MGNGKFGPFAISETNLT